MALTIKTAKVLLFLAALILLQQVIALGHRYSPQWHDQATLISEQDIDPSALFYMESKLALAAEKQVRQTLDGSKPE